VSGLVVLVFTIILIYAITSKEKPVNLVIVLVDTLRSDHLGYHGYTRPTSPKIDGLANRSIVFKNHYSHSSRTGPSVASIFTGLDPRSHGVVNPLTHFGAVGTLSESQETIAEILNTNGYQCYGYVANLNVTARFGFGQGFDQYEFLTSTSAVDISRLAAQVISEQPEPFFLYLHYLEPHSPYSAPGSYRHLFVEPGYNGPINGTHHQLDEIVAGKLVPDTGDMAHLEALHDQEIRYFDDVFGDLLDLLRKNKLSDNTIIVFVADHGEEFWDHESVLHGYTLYEEQLRVPMFIHDPRRERPETIETITRHIDLLPTILDMLDLNIETQAQGASLTPWMDGKETPAAVGPVHAQVSLRAVKLVQLVSFMRDGWKLIVQTLPQASIELYHVQSDPT
jgi:arylsulfatase A-like enzyme